MGVAGGVGTAVAIATGGVPVLETVGTTVTMAGDGVLGWAGMVWNPIIKHMTSLE